MLKVGEVLVSNDVVDEKFICDLNKCKGACCVEGESGAPLEEEELKQLEKIYSNVKPYLTEDGIKAIDEQGLYLKDFDGDWVTPLMWEGGPCAYTIFENGIALCGIEKAYRDKKIKFYKPISCHLYPIRVLNTKAGDALNYHEWEVCSPACKLGKKEKVRVFEFLKTSLVRKYGQTWYDELMVKAAEYIEEKVK
jgi:hypothetical protein